MTKTDQVTSPARGDRDDGDVRAELVLARLIDARAMLAASPAVRALTIATEVSLVITGAWLRGQLPARWPVLAAACGLLALLGLAIPFLAVRAGKREPAWARAAEAHQRSLPSRIEPAVLEVLLACLAGLPARWPGHHLYVSRCGDSSPGHFGACQGAGVVPMKGGLLVIVGEHLTAWPASAVAAVLAHESLHVTGWRFRVSCLAKVAGLAGWLLIGWAVPWPAVIATAAGLRMALTGLSWLIEASCDAGAARKAGTGQLLDALARAGQAAAADAARSPARRHAASFLRWLAGPVHPPLPLRSALLRVLARRAPVIPYPGTAGPRG